MTNHEIVENFIQNLEKERLKLGMTQSQMAAALGLSVSGYKKIIAGETTKIDLTMAFRMYQLTGRPPLEMGGMLPPEMSFLHKYLKLYPSQQSFVEGITDFELDFQLQYPDTEEYLSVLVPTGNMEDGMLFDSCHIEKVNAAPYFKRFGDLLHCGFRIASNHLHPVYHKGDIILVCRKPPRDGDTGIFIHKESGRAYLRRFRQGTPCLLEPINGYGNTFRIDGSSEEQMSRWIKFGYVLTKMREI